MPQYEIIEQEGVRLVKIILQNETVRAESGALYYMRGNIEMESKAPSVGGFFKSLATGESVFRPTYTGTGELYLEPSLGGFHVQELQGEEWILEGGAYWASDASIELDVHREKALTALKSGEGFLDFQTKVRGVGKVVLSAQGPVEEVVLENDKMVVDGRYVLGRSGSVNYSAQRAAKSLLGSLTSGEGLVRIYEGSGRLLMAAVPYWRHRLHSSIAGAMAARTSSS